MNLQRVPPKTRLVAKRKPISFTFHKPRCKLRDLYALKRSKVTSARGVPKKETVQERPPHVPHRKSTDVSARKNAITSNDLDELARKKVRWSGNPRDGGGLLSMRKLATALHALDEKCCNSKGPDPSPKELRGATFKRRLRVHQAICSRLFSNKHLPFCTLRPIMLALDTPWLKTEKTAWTLHLFQTGFAFDLKSAGSFVPYSRATLAFLDAVHCGHLPDFSSLPQRVHKYARNSSGAGYRDGGVLVEVRDFRGVTQTAPEPLERRFWLRSSDGELRQDLNHQVKVGEKEEHPFQALLHFTCAVQHSCGERMSAFERVLSAAVAAGVGGAEPEPTGVLQLGGHASLELKDVVNRIGEQEHMAAAVMRTRKPQLCLDPSPLVFQAANVLHFNARRNLASPLSPAEVQRCMQPPAHRDPCAYALPPPSLPHKRRRTASSPASPARKRRACTRTPVVVPQGIFEGLRVEPRVEASEAGGVDESIETQEKRRRLLLDLASFTAYCEKGLKHACHNTLQQDPVLARYLLDPLKDDKAPRNLHLPSSWVIRVPQTPSRGYRQDFSFTCSNTEAAQHTYEVYTSLAKAGGGSISGRTPSGLYEGLLRVVSSGEALPERSMRFHMGNLEEKQRFLEQYRQQNLLESKALPKHSQ